MSVGWGVKVNVGIRVSVGLGSRVFVGVREGVRDGDGTCEAVGVAVHLRIRVRVGGTGVQVTNGLVGVMYTIAVMEGVMDAVSVGVGVGTYSEISTAVSAAAVLMGLEKAESTISCAPIFDALCVPGFARAAAETMQIRLNPSTPAPKTVRGPEYSRIFTLVALHLRQIKGGFASLAIGHALSGRKVISRPSIALSKQPVSGRYNLKMSTMFQIVVFLAGFLTVLLTLSSALSTFVLPRAARSQLNRIVFGLLRRLFDFILHFAKTYPRKDAVMAYYAPIGLMLLVPTWYILIMLGFAAMYWAMGVGDFFAAIRLSGSSLLTLGFESNSSFPITLFEFLEAMLGLILVALLIAYLPTLYSAFSRREQVVNMLEVRAGSPPSALEMLLRFHRNQGLEKLADYWKVWEAWFADVEESHTTLPALIFFRSPRAENSWVTAAGAVLDAAAITLSTIDIPYDVSAALSIRAGFLTFRRIATYFDIPLPSGSALSRYSHLCGAC